MHVVSVLFFASAFTVVRFRSHIRRFPADLSSIAVALRLPSLAVALEPARSLPAPTLSVPFFPPQHLRACRRRTPRTSVDVKVIHRRASPRPFQCYPPIRSSPQRSPSARAEKLPKIDPRTSRSCTSGWHGSCCSTLSTSLPGRRPDFFFRRRVTLAWRLPARMPVQMPVSMSVRMSTRVSVHAHAHASPGHRP